jgi:hypothetical protein
MTKGQDPAPRGSGTGSRGSEIAPRTREHAPPLQRIRALDRHARRRAAKVVAPDVSANDVVSDFVTELLDKTTRNLWVCSLPNKDDGGGGSRRCVRTRDVDRIVEFCKKYDVRGNAIYYCVSSIEGRERNLETVAETPILWFDLDYKDVEPPPDQILARIKSNGLHGIYVLEKPWEGNIRPALHRLCDVVGGDRKVCHPAALLRMPGTHNSKDGAWKLVEVLK